MRNIAVYSLTDREILEWLDQMYQEELKSERIGGLDLMILEALKQRIEEHPYQPKEIRGNL